jgi:iron complex outermembrane receptor protein
MPISILRASRPRAVLFVGASVASLSLAGASGARAQTVGAAAVAAPPPQSSTSVQELVVTGSLIRRTDVETPSPVTVLTADTMAKQGLTNTSDALRSIAADNSGTIPNAFSDGFAAGSSGIALRGLTVNSTLVLIDGLRTTDYPLPDDGVRGFVDLNTILFSSVQQVEVLKDGASSIYGADAIGGVVNIIMKPTFTGEEADAELGGTQHGGGFSQRYYATVGYGDLDKDRYNVYIDGEYQSDAAIHGYQRGFPYNTNDLSSIGGANNIGGQPANGLNIGSIYGAVAPATLGPGGVLSGIATGAPYQLLRPCGGATVQSTDSSGNVYCAQNFANYTDIQPKETRFGVVGRFTVQLTPNLQAWLTASYAQNQTTVGLAPAQIQNNSPINTDTIALPATLPGGGLNPNDPFAALGEAALINYAFGDIPSYLKLTNHVFREVAGLKGSNGGWDWQASLNFNHAYLDTVAAGFLYEPQLISDVENGTYNFVNPSANSASVINALAPTLYKTSHTDLDSLDLSATRKLWNLPGGPLALAIGGQVRYEDMANPDINTNNMVAGGDGSMQPTFTFGHRTVEGIFFEVDAPVVKPLEIDVSGRYDHYSDVGGDFSPKVGFKYTPIRQIVFRGTYSEGFRAPSFSESGNSLSVGYINYSPNSSLPASADFIAAHGGNAYATAPYELNLASAGNPNIKPERSHSYTIGTVIEPNHWFNVSVDYYHISKKDVIGNPNTGVILDDYYQGLPLPTGVKVIGDAPDPQFPSALPRPIYIDEPYVNTNSEWTDGLDIDLRAHFDLPFEVRWTSDFNFTDIFHFVYDNGGTVLEYVGTQAPYELSSGAGTPKYRANWANSFTWQRLTVTGTVYYVSSIKETGVDATGVTPGSPAPCLYFGEAGNEFPNGCNISPYWDFDLNIRVKINDRIYAYATLYDVFDTKPPLDPADYAGGPYGLGANYNPTYAQTDAVGRAFKIGFHVKY